jgi:hypothetical protein
MIRPRQGECAGSGEFDRAGLWINYGLDVSQ